MRCRLPILMGMLACVAVSTLAAQDAQVGHDGNELVLDAAQKVNRQPPLEAKVRQWATMFGQCVSGAGFYLQMRDADRILLRYEFKLQVADQMTSLLQVNDGTTLWLRQDYGELHSQAYVNVRRLREARQQQTGEANAASRFAPDLALGGLGEMLNNIEQNFQFGEPQQNELKGIPTWEVTGHWKPHRLGAMTPSAAQNGEVDASSLPAHAPNVVKVVLGRDDNFPLFPYRIMFGRTHRRDSVTSIGIGDTPSVDPLVTIALSEVCRRPDLTASDFAFQPSDQNVEDRTDIYLKKLGLVKEEKAER